MKIALFGMHPETQTGYVPEDWDETWGLAHDQETMLRCDRAFEAHSEQIVRAHNAAHVGRLKYLAEHMPLTTAWMWSEPLGVNHKTLEYADLTHGDLIESSIAYMMAVAMEQRPQVIGVFGVDMAEGDEYAYQRPNMAYLIGKAEGLGIKVYLHPASRLLKSGWTGGCYGHPANVGDMDYKLGPKAAVQDESVASAA